MAAVDWITSTELKTQLDISGSGRDGVITAAITSASRTLNRRSGRELTPQTSGVTRTFPIKIRSSRADMLLVDLAPYDLRVATTVTLHPESPSPKTLVADTDYTPWPVGGRRTTGTYTKLRLSAQLASLWSAYGDKFGVAKIQVFGDWGAWDTASVPEDLKRACVVTVGSWIDKAVAEYGADFESQPRAMQAAMFDSYAVPRPALNILASAGVLPSPIL